MFWGLQLLPMRFLTFSFFLKPKVKREERKRQKGTKTVKFASFQREADPKRATGITVVQTRSEGEEEGGRQMGGRSTNKEAAETADGVDKQAA